MFNFKFSYICRLQWIFPLGEIRKLGGDQMKVYNDGYIATSIQVHNSLKQLKQLPD